MRDQTSSEPAPELNEVAHPDFIDAELALSPYKLDAWLALTPGERLQRAWELRKRLVNPRDAHDRKLFPMP